MNMKTAPRPVVIPGDLAKANAKTSETQLHARLLSAQIRSAGEAYTQPNAETNGPPPRGAAHVRASSPRPSSSDTELPTDLIKDGSTPQLSSHAFWFAD